MRDDIAVTTKIARIILIGMALYGYHSIRPQLLEAASVQMCVTCTDPDKTYLCDVETNNSLQNEKGLQLYCIIRTSREGGHRSCAVDQTPAAQCVGDVKSYSFNAPKIPENVKRALAKRRSSNMEDAPSADVPSQRGGEPETLIEMTRGAVGASKEGIKNSGEVVGNAAGATKNTVGKAARGVGKGVSTAANKVGSATKKTGHVVGSTAKGAWDCVKSLFKGCGSSHE